MARAPGNYYFNAAKAIERGMRTKNLSIVDAATKAFCSRRVLVINGGGAADG